MARALTLGLLVVGAGCVLWGQDGFGEAQAFLQQYCAACHGEKGVGGFSVPKLAAGESLRSDAHKWTRARVRVLGGEMPPKGAPMPPMALKDRFAGWVEKALHEEACRDGVQAGPAPIRRLNRDEYAATLRDLLDMQLDVSQRLPEDGAGGEGFDNAAETLFLSPLHAEKYLETAKFALDYAAKEYKPRVRILVAEPGKGVTEEQAARKILDHFLPLAFRRPVGAEETAPYLALYAEAKRQGMKHEEAVFFALRGVLVSPMFLFHSSRPNTTGKTQALDQYALASRLAYFLWGSMPDELLMDLAAAGKLGDEEVLRAMTRRMLRNDRSLQFAQRFMGQWLHTRELGLHKTPDAKLFPAYATDEDLRGDIRFQPILFFQEILVKNLPLTDLIESDWTIGTRTLVRFFGEKIEVRANASQQPQVVKLPEGSVRGGLLGMPAVLAVSSYPYRTSPVLRGAWILENLMGTPPPPPPPNVPQLEEAKEGAAPKTMRERLSRHRDNEACMSCHTRIDPLGFALENFDAIGKWRDQEEGLAIDAAAETAEGVKIDGPRDLKRHLLDHKEMVVRNVAAKMLGYALGRGLTLADGCTVDAIVSKVKEDGYKARALVEAIVLSVPFRYQAPAASAPIRKKT